MTRVLYPGFLINAIDGEEAYCLCGTRGARANYPCARCLVYKTDLTKLDTHFELRTNESMIKVYNEAVSHTSMTAALSVLQQTGLHLIEVS